MEHEKGEFAMKNRNANIVFSVIIIILIFVGCPFALWSYKEYSFHKNLSSNIRIVCWGDSLTFGAGGMVEGNRTTFPRVLEECIKANIGDIKVYNLGVGGETTRQIRARSGALGIRVKNDIIIPADVKPTKIELVLSDGYDANILRQGNAGIEEVSIDGIRGSLSIEQANITSDDYTYYFTRNNKGKEIEVEAGTNVEVTSSLKYKSCVPIIFMGTNGGWTTPDDLISQIESMIDNQYKIGTERYLVLGLTTGTAEERKELEDAMAANFGDHYINLREYLSTNALSDAGIEPTDEDKELMAVGSVPISLRSDKIHLNATGYELVGKLIYNRMVELRYFNYKIKGK